jgi:hypothetical protein
MKEYNEYDLFKMRIVELVATSKNQRIRPIHAIQTLTRERDISASAVKGALEKLVNEGELVYTYRDPCSYVEIPCNGCDGEHLAARPMKTVIDDSGNAWLCDADIKSSDYLYGQNCWEYGSLNFTRSG